jgi:hypothetical protein
MTDNIQIIRNRLAFQAMAALLILWGFGYQTVWQRLTIQIEGTIVSSRDEPVTGAPRYVTYYVVRGTDGNDRAYVAGASDTSLQRHMPVGAHIHKVWGELGYEVDGRWIAFPLGFYGGFLCLAGILLGLAVKNGLRLWKGRQKP